MAESVSALLKLLEEPPPRAVLLLVTHAPGRLLPTIRSREEAEKVRARLRQSVTAAFEARQNGQRAELAELQKRLDRVEKLIESRQRQKERIIDRRVEELLDPAVKWPSPGQPDAPTRSPGEPDVTKDDPLPEGYLERAKERVELLRKANRTSSLRMSELLSAEREFLEADLQAARSPGEKVEALRRGVGELEKLLNRAKAQEKIGRIASSEVLAVELAFLKTKGELERVDDNPTSPTRGRD